MNRNRPSPPNLATEQSSEAMPLPRDWPELTAFLAQRRSNMAKMMSGPGPDAKALEQILTIAARVPDHRKLSPWRFVIFQDKARADFGQIIAARFAAQNPDLPIDRTVFEGARLMRAPTVIAVISSPKQCVRGTPEWEQVLSAGAVCYNMLLAAQSKGFAAQWLTEWFAYDQAVLATLRVQDHEKVAGFIYLGQAETPSRERVRPDINTISEYWAQA